MAATSSAGTLEAPVPAILSAETSAVSSPGWASRASTRDHWVGTPWATVIRSCSMMRTASAARHGVGVITVVIPLAISSQGRAIDPTWAKGKGDSRRSPGSDSTSVPSATAARLAWSKTAPLGSPDVPLVQTTATGSCRDSFGHRDGAAPPVALHTVERSSTAPDRPACGAAPSSTTVTVGRVRCRMDRASADPSRRLIPEVTAPRRAAAA